MRELKNMMVAQLRDAFSAEKQAIQVMRKMMRKVSEPKLREGLEAHVSQSEEQRDRVEQALEKLGARPGRKVCEAMRGLVEEAQHEAEEFDKGPILDLVIVAAQQRIEHYEIAAYGTDIALAQALGEGTVVALLEEILAEEKQTDVKLTEVTQSSLMAAAMGGAAANDAKSGGKRKAS